MAGPLVGLTRQRNFAARWVKRICRLFDDDIVLEPGCAELNGPSAPRRRLVVRAISKTVVALAADLALRTAEGIAASRRDHVPLGHVDHLGFLPPNEELTEGQWLPGVAMWKTAVVGNWDFSKALRLCQGKTWNSPRRTAGTRHGQPGSHLHGAADVPTISNVVDHLQPLPDHRRGLEDRTWRSGVVLLCLDGRQPAPPYRASPDSTLGNSPAVRRPPATCCKSTETDGIVRYFLLHVISIPSSPPP